jgi:hypothetical protein
MKCHNLANREQVLGGFQKSFGIPNRHANAF